MAKEQSAKEQAEYLKGMRSYSNAVVKEMQQMDGLSASTSKKMAGILTSMKGQNSAAGALNALRAKRQEFIETEIAAGRKISQAALERLDLEEELLEKKKELEEIQENIKDVGKDFAKDLGAAVGVSNELVSAFMTLSAAAIGFAILKEVVTYIGEGVKRMREFNKETGASLGTMMEMEGSLNAARMEAGFLKYSMEEVRAASDAVRKSTGQIVVDPSLVADITEVNSVLKDADKAQSLTRTLKNSGKDAGELTKEIKEMANSMNMDAGPAMEFLADNQLELRGLTKEQIAQRAQEALIVKKMGVDLKKARDLASQSLDIEKSMKDEMKLRMMTGKQIDMSGLRAAQISGDALAVAREQKKLIDSVGPSLNGNLQLQRMIGDATGMTADEMLNIQNATDEAAGAQLDANKATEEGNTIFASILGNLDKILIGAGLLIATLMVFGKIPTPKFLKSKGGSNPIANFIGKFGSTEVLKGAAAMLLVSASMFVMAKAIAALPTEVGPYVGMAVGLGLMLGALYLLAKFPTADLIKGALALVLVGVSLIPFAFAMSLIAGIEIGNILAVAAGIVIFTAMIMGLGLVMFSGVGALIFGAGILAILALGAAMIVLGAGIVIFNKGMSGLGDNISLFVEKMGELISVAPMMLGAVAPLMLFGMALIPFALGMMIATVPMLAFGLAMIPFVAGITLLSSVLPTFIESIKQLVEQAPQLLVVAGAFTVFSAALMMTTMAMLPFFPTFMATTLGVTSLIPMMLVASLAINIWALSLSNLSDSIQRLMPNLTAFLSTMPLMSAMIMLVPGLLALSASFVLLSASLIALSGGLAIVTLFLPTLFALAFALPLISDALGFSGDGEGSSSESTGEGKIVEAIKDLKQSIDNQPLQLVIDGKVINEFTKAQSRKQSTRSSGYFSTIFGD